MARTSTTGYRDEQVQDAGDAVEPDLRAYSEWPVRSQIATNAISHWLFVAEGINHRS